MISLIYTLENDCLRVEVNSLGAELWSLFDKRDGTQHLWQGDPNTWPRRAPTLFPIVGRLKNDVYQLHGKEHPMAQHGFARDFEHTCIQQVADRICFRFDENEATRRNYPYSFVLETIFTLDRNQLVQEFTITNRNDQVMPFSIGFHTGFACPFHKNSSLSHYDLIFEQPETAVRLGSNPLLTGARTPYLDNQNTLPLLGQPLTSTVILEGLRSSHVDLADRTTGSLVRVGIQGFPYVAFWSIQEDLPFVCIEPWYGLPDPEGSCGDLLQKPAIQLLDKNSTFTCAQSITVIKPEFDRL